MTEQQQPPDEPAPDRKELESLREEVASLKARLRESDGIRRALARRLKKLEGSGNTE